MTSSTSFSSSSSILRGVFAGSFDPFTVGHADLVDRALKVVDELIILVAFNPDKPSHTPLEHRLERLMALYEGQDRIRIVLHEGLTAKYALSLGGDVVLIRGVRGGKDLAYEQELAEVNRTHFGIDTVFFFSSPSLQSVSSSMVRELASFGEDVSRYLP